MKRIEVFDYIIAFEEYFMPESQRGGFLLLCPRCKAPLAPLQATCYRCGLRLPQRQSNSTTRQARPSSPPRLNKVRRFARKHPTLLYFSSIFLFILLFAFLLLRSDALSLPNFFSKSAATPSVTAYPIPKESPLFSDNFANDNGWNLESAPGKYAVNVGNSALTLEVDQQKLLWELIPGERSYGNFILTVNAALTQGGQNDGYGIYIRGASNSQSDLATWYRFELYGDGSYAIFKGTTGANGTFTSTKLVDYTLNSAIRPQGKVNHIMLIARGATMAFVVNDQLVKSISDSTYARGTIALFVSHLLQAPPGAQAQFSHLAIYPMQA